MRIALFYHSLLSDWNHGNAHFLRGYATELLARGHEVLIFEQENNWSLSNLLREHSEAALRPFRRAYPGLASRMYAPETLDLEASLRGVDLIIAHEWNGHALIAQLGRYRAAHPSVRLLFHDTHHRAVSQPQEMARYDLSRYDGALVFGEVLRALYMERGWVRSAWTWHEAADTRVFRPCAHEGPMTDVLWIGNWGDEERSAELHEFLIEPVRRLGLTATAYGVRYPREAVEAMGRAGIRYAGWLSNAAAPPVFGAHRIALHIPRRFYKQTLPGIPTIRVFEALACGTPLISAPWRDSEGLFAEGDFARVSGGDEMTRTLRRLLDDPNETTRQARAGLATISARHTCAHRVDQLLSICDEIGLETGSGLAQTKEAAA